VVHRYGCEGPIAAGESVRIPFCNEHMRFSGLGLVAEGIPPTKPLRESNSLKNPVFRDVHSQWRTLGDTMVLWEDVSPHISQTPKDPNQPTTSVVKSSWDIC
jgi:hypothetical protein